MSAVSLGLCVAAAWFVLVNAAVTAFVIVAGPSLLRLAHDRSAIARARAAYGLRMAPAAISGFVAVGLVLPAFVRHEPANAVEPVSLTMLVAAAIAVGLVVVRAAKALTAWRALRRLLGSPAAHVQDVIVVPDDTLSAALAGVLRPVVIVSRRLLDRLTGNELAAVVAHERAHARAGDNLKRLALALAPDLLHGTSCASALETAWARAAEEMADAEVIAGGAAVDLASALVKAARLAVPGAAHPLTSGVLAGGDVTVRVTRLLASDTERSPSGSAAPAATGPAGLKPRGSIDCWEYVSATGVLGAAGASALTSFSLHIHEVSEFLVRVMAKI